MGCLNLDTELCRDDYDFGYMRSNQNYLFIDKAPISLKVKSPSQFSISYQYPNEDIIQRVPRLYKRCNSHTFVIPTQLTFNSDKEDSTISIAIKQLDSNDITNVTSHLDMQDLLKHSVL